MLLKAQTTRAGVSARQARSAFAPVRSVRAPLAVRAQKKDCAETQAFEAGKIAALSAVASSWMFSGQAQAAVELANVAASDNRLGTISLLFLPALGWVAFNILQPAFNQLNRMSEIKEETKASSGKPGGKKKRGLAGAVGMGAALSMMAAQQADAATELMQVAASDNRLATISLLFLPAVGWVAFNMAQPALNQLNRMNEIKEEAAPARAGGKKKRGLAGAVGMGAALSMMAAQQADAATELMQVAASDNRLGVISLLFLPAIGWVAFNMAQPAFNQLNRMNEIKAEAAGASSSKARRR
jgi:photosystem II PsbY protein